MMWWKVKKLMPMGSVRCSRPTVMPVSAVKVAAKKSAYLYKPSTHQGQNDRGGDDRTVPGSPKPLRGQPVDDD